MTVEEIRVLIQLAHETGVAELEVQRGDNRVRIRRGSVTSQEVLNAPPAAGVAAPAPTAAGEHQGVGGLALGKVESSDPNLILVKSPIVGTFYECPSPGAAPFVRVGERIQPGKVLCIIESMKLMNEIEAETAGIVESKLVLNGQPVEYGEALFAIRPV